MADSLDLFTPRPRRRLTIDERFAAWRTAHPEAVELMRRLALQRVLAGSKRVGIAALFERCRWDMELAAPEGGFRLNHDLRAPLARHLMEIEPALRGAFEIRERRSA